MKKCPKFLCVSKILKLLYHSLCSPYQIQIINIYLSCHEHLEAVSFYEPHHLKTSYLFIFPNF